MTLLAGCASSSPGWTKAGASEKQVGQDTNDCLAAAQMTVGGRLVIGQSGIVHADIHTVDMVVMGTYEGNLVATGNVEITATGKVTGNIETDSLVIAKGGFFNGNVTKMNEPSPNGQHPVYLIEDKRAGQQGGGR